MKSTARLTLTVSEAAELLGISGTPAYEYKHETSSHHPLIGRRTCRQVMYDAHHVARRPGGSRMNTFKQVLALSVWVALAEAARFGEAVRNGVKLAST